MFKTNILEQHIPELYAEMGQPNPLRWRIMHRKGDVLTSQSHSIKCKDFFNDVVAYRVGKHRFSIYNFKNNIKFNREGMYLLLTEIANREQFLYNFAVVAVKLEEDLNITLQNFDVEDGVVVLIPQKVLRSTYYVSLLTMMIRCCNYNVKYESWDDFFTKDAPMQTTENAFTKEAKEYTQQNGFVLPEGFAHRWYSSCFGWSSDSDKPVTATVIHNNGVCDWVKSIKEAK